jgi:hypothetical protein
MQINGKISRSGDDQYVGQSPTRDRLMFMAYISFAIQAAQLQEYEAQEQSQLDLQDLDSETSSNEPEIFTQWFVVDGKLVRHWLPNN